MSSALVCTAPTGEDGLEIREQPDRPLKAGELRIAVRAASVNYPDVLLARGEYQVRLEPPFVAGNECAGEIAEVGPGVTGWKAGDAVLALTGFGAFATEVITDTKAAHVQVFRIPASMSWAEAASLNMTYGTAYHGLVIAIAGGRAKCDLARRLGADVVIDHTAVADYSGPVREATHSFGVNVFFDPVGGADIRPALRSIGWAGRYLVVGFVAGIPVVRLNQALLKNISLVGVAYGPSAMADPEASNQDWGQLFRWYEEGKVKPAVGEVYPLARAVEAIQAVGERRAVGKVVIDMAAPA